MYTVWAQGPELTGTAGAPWSPGRYEAHSLEREIGYGGGSAYREGGPSSVGTRPALYRTYAEGVGCGPSSAEDRPAFTPRPWGVGVGLLRNIVPVSIFPIFVNSCRLRSINRTYACRNHARLDERRRNPHHFTCEPCGQVGRD